jgi:CheY-like chemotaxis protein
MNQLKEQPLVLVADDDQEFREDILPEALGRLNARIVTAKDVLEACLVAAEHHARSKDPLHLVVLDMHMPPHADATAIAGDGGLQFLLAQQFTECSVVVFTAYPSYQNCVRAVRAGAAAYLPKKIQDTYGGPEGGVDQLVEICRNLLARPEADSRGLTPDGNWIDQQDDWLSREFSGRWVAFIPASEARSAGISGQERGGLVIVSKDSQQSLATLIAEKLHLLSRIPPIAFIQPT